MSMYCTKSHILQQCILPSKVAKTQSLQAARIHAEELANRLGLSGFARIDAFLGVEDGTLFVIEINTVPGLSPNNVLFQQALLEVPPIFPGEFCRLQVWYDCVSSSVVRMRAVDRSHNVPISLSLLIQGLVWRVGLCQCF